MIRWTDQALADLESVHDYIGKDNLTAAERTVENILRGLRTAEAFPDSGRRGSRVPGTRELILAPYIVVYRAMPACIGPCCHSWIEAMASCIELLKIPCGGYALRTY